MIMQFHTAHMHNTSACHFDVGLTWNILTFMSEGHGITFIAEERKNRGHICLKKDRVITGLILNQIIFFNQNWIIDGATGKCKQEFYEVT